MIEWVLVIQFCLIADSGIRSQCHPADTFTAIVRRFPGENECHAAEWNARQIAAVISAKCAQVPV